MLKDIKKSPEFMICQTSSVKRTFSSVLKNIPGMDEEINKAIRHGEDKQIMSIEESKKVISNCSPMVLKMETKKRG